MVDSVRAKANPAGPPVAEVEVEAVVVVRAEAAAFAAVVESRCGEKMRMNRIR